MIDSSPHPQPPRVRPPHATLSQPPTQVWQTLTPSQQRQVHQTLVHICRQLAQQAKNRKQPHEHP